MHYIGIALGYRSLGGVPLIVRALRARGLTPVLVADEHVADYSRDLIERGRVIASDETIRHPAAFAGKLFMLLDRMFGAGGYCVLAIVNFQDRMWPLYMQLARLWPSAATTPVNIVERTAIKPNFRHVTANTEFGVKYAVVPSATAVEDILALDRLGDQVIVKPVAGSGGDHVRRIARSDRAGVHAAVSAIRASYEGWGRPTAPLFDFDGSEMALTEFVLVEELVAGTEFSVEGHVTRDGRVEPLVVLRKTDTREQPFRDLEYVWPTAEPTSKRVADDAQALLRHVGYFGQAFHLEMKYDGTGAARPIELNPRQGGGSIGDFVEAITGVNLHARTVHGLLEGRSAPNASLVLRVIQPPGDLQHGTYCLEGCPGLSELQSDDSCVYARRFVDDGTLLEIGNQEHYLVEFAVGTVGEERAIAKARAIEERLAPKLSPTRLVAPK